jgi:predicted AAA+ superfamily ATPase
VSKKKTDYQRPQAAVLAERLAEPRRFVQVVAGPRQVGKSTLVQQVTAVLDVPVRYVSADEPSLRGPDWIGQQWEAARLEVTGKAGAVLVLDEMQKIPAWSEAVKRLWDEDTRKKRPLKVVLLGSAPLLIAQGLTESLAGRWNNTSTSAATPAPRRWSATRPAGRATLRTASSRPRFRAMYCC